MKKLKRYSLQHGPDHVSEVKEDNNGKYIEYKQYEKLTNYIITLENIIKDYCYENSGNELDERKKEMCRNILENK